MNFGSTPIEIRLTRDDAPAPTPAQDTSTQNRRKPPVEPSLGRDPEEEEI